MAKQSNQSTNGTTSQQKAGKQPPAKPSRLVPPDPDYVPSAHVRKMATSSLEDQVDALSQPNLPRKTRQDIAFTIARLRGNRHLQRVLDSLIQRENGDTTISLTESNTETINEIKEILKNSWVGPLDEYNLESLWGRFGSALGMFINESPDNYRLFLKSMERGAELEDLAAITNTRKDFKKDVVALALEYLTKNEQHILKEMEKVGLSPGMCMPMTDERAAQIEQTKETARRVLAAQQVLKSLKQIPVGYTKVPDVIGYGGYSTKWVPSTFHPAGPPSRGPKPEDTEMPPWEAVNTQYQAVSQLIAKYAADYPALFAMMREDSGLEKFVAGETPEEAQLKIGDALNTVLGNIRKTRAALQTDDLDYQDLKPIHQQLFDGKRKGPNTGTDWSKNYEKWVGNYDVKDHEMTEFWITLGLGGVAAVAFIVAEIATAGTATFFIAAGVGLTAGATQAAMSWEKYDDLATAAEANVREDLKLADKSQADAALVNAVLDTAFLFLDIYGPAKAARGFFTSSARAGTVAATKITLTGLEQMPRHLAQGEVGKAIAQYGVEETVKKSGKSVDDLVKIVGENSEAGKALSAYKRAGGLDLGKAAEALPNLAESIKKGMSLGEADKLVMASVNQNGAAKTIQMAGGWKKLAAALGDGTTSGKFLKQWRDGVYADLEKFVNSTLRKADDPDMLLKKTGTDAFSSDLDISFLGPRASANREAGFNFLQGRLGVGDRKQLSAMLDMDLFTDPRRMHLYDQLDPAIRSTIQNEAAALERSIIFNQRLAQAEKQGNKVLAAKIEEQMKMLNIPKQQFKELTAESIQALSKEIDNLHAQLAKATDPATKQKLAREIAEKQAFINASEKGGYFSGGGVRKFVTERDKLMSDTEIAKYPISNPAIANAVFDQLPKLDKAAAELRKVAQSAATAEADDVFKALKDFGKYGDRLGESAQLLLGKGKYTQLDDLANKLKKLIEDARPVSEKVDTLVAHKQADALEQYIPLMKKLNADKVAIVNDAIADLNKLESIMDDLLTVINKTSGLDKNPKAIATVQELLKAQASLISAREEMVKSLNKFKDRSIIAASTGGRAGRAAKEYEDAK